MAHYKRGKCRYHLHKTIRGSEASRLARIGRRPVRPRDGLKRWQDDEFWKVICDWRWLSTWPRSHDYIYHTRPHRAATKRLEREIKNGVDPDNVVWPLAKRPHHYCW